MARGKKRSIPMFPPELLGDVHDLPDCETDTAAWVKATDAIAKKRFDPSQPLPRDFQRGQSESFFEGMMNDDVLQEIINARRIGCTSHLHLSQIAMDYLTQLDFENTWIKLGKAGQEVHIFKAHREQDEEDNRAMGSFSIGKTECPELCSDQLMRGDGKGFIELLQIFLLENNQTPPTQPFILENARYDKIIGWMGDDDPCKNRKVFLGLRRLMRTYYISSFCLHVLMSIDGRKIKRVKYTNEHFKTKETLEKMKPMMDHFVGPELADQWQRDEAQKRKEMVLFCSACLKPEQKDVTGKMPACTKCKAIGREIRYCNKTCQKAAWKTHKLECGKPYDVSQVLNDVVPFSTHDVEISPRPDIPKALPGYRRSPHLIRQIEYLTNYPTKDYVLLLPPVKNSRYEELNGVSLDTPHGAAAFIIMRNRVMMGLSTEQGVDSAMLYMYRVLQRSVTEGEMEESMLREQLGKEHGETWERVLKADKAGKPPGNPGKVSRQEIDHALGCLKRLGRFGAVLKEYVPGRGQSVCLPIMVGPKKDVMVEVDFPKELMPPGAEDWDMRKMIQLAALLAQQQG